MSSSDHSSSTIRDRVYPVSRLIYIDDNSHRFFFVYRSDFKRSSKAKGTRLGACATGCTSGLVCIMWICGNYPRPWNSSGYSSAISCGIPKHPPRCGSSLVYDDQFSPIPRLCRSQILRLESVQRLEVTSRF